MARIVSRLTGDSFAYPFHIGMFHAQRRLGRKRATIEPRKKSQIGDGFISGADRRILKLGRAVQHHVAQLGQSPPRSKCGLADNTNVAQLTSL